MSADNTNGPGYFLVPSGEDLVVSGDGSTYTLWRVVKLPDGAVSTKAPQRPARDLRFPVASSPSLGTIRAAMRLLGAQEAQTNGPSPSDG